MVRNEQEVKKDLRQNLTVFLNAGSYRMVEQLLPIYEERFEFDEWIVNYQRCYELLLKS
jgi:hypothetical protein|tara:strand:- start:109 stop:285 length:177 start_codon:yes stop_codon:yes gene_type:complete